MLTHLILACVAIGIFLAYNVVMFCLFGMPCSLSNTYYYLNNRWPNSGWFFTGMMYVVCFLLIGPWIEVTQFVSPWSHYLTILPFLTVLSLLFVATAPNFRTDKSISAVHMTCAKLAAVFALLWVCVVCWKIMYIIPAWALVLGGLAHATKTARSGRDWWVEMVAFFPTFTAIIVELATHLNQ